MRKKLSVSYDLDGVTYNFVEALRLSIHRRTGRPLETMPDAQTWEFYKHQWSMTTEEFLQHFADGINDGFIFRHGAPYPGAVEAMRRIADAGHEIHIVTARHIPGAEEMAERNTRAWLDEHNVPYTTLTFSDAKDIVPTDVFIEDRDVNYDALEAAGCFPWLITRPWNAHHPGRRVDTHAEFIAVVERLSSGRAAA